MQISLPSINPTPPPRDSYLSYICVDDKQVYVYLPDTGCYHQEWKPVNKKNKKSSMSHYHIFLIMKKLRYFCAICNTYG